MPGFEIIDHQEKEAVNQIFEDGGILFAHGFDAMRKNFHVREFEDTTKQYLECEHALAVTSGTAAIKVALKSIGVKKGDEVITQAFNFIATIEAILDVGAKPIIANVDNSLNMDPEDCESLITDKTKAILPVHMLGVPVEMDQIMKIAQKHNLKVMEDNCESVGARYKKRYLGTIGDVGALSFDFGKVITTGEGGMVITNTLDIDRYSREYHDHGHENNPNFPRGRDTKTIFGFNYRITEMQAAVGKVQLSKLDYIINENKKRYQAFESNLPSNIISRIIPDGSDPIYDTYIFFIDSKEERERIINILNSEGFGTKNLPDAIEWHCSAFWDHALDDASVKHSQKTKELLEKAIAVPMWLRKNKEDYSDLAIKIFGRDL
ncbi:MAG: DegT/DnrJ/EryC1/StrS family aminotransferase [Gammaproteobacteria bacterium]|nr:DegT/DnrJ/EryC1/StrS family aminotransferase [Gammaproteobacteria bacterium]